MKKLNLESIGVQELTTVENREIDGGILILGAIAVGMSVLIVAGPILAWSQGSDHQLPGQQADARHRRRDGNVPGEGRLRTGDHVRPLQPAGEL